MGQSAYQIAMKEMGHLIELANLKQPIIDSINAQLADIGINVKVFGAKGDGVTDDTKAIQKAIDSAGDGGVIFFPVGIYITTEPLVIKRGQQLRGSGGVEATTSGIPLGHTAYGTIIKKINSVGKPGLSSYNRSGVLIDLSIINAIVIACTSDFNYDSIACVIENISLEADKTITPESRPSGIYLFRCIQSKISFVNMHNVYRGIDGDDYFKNEITSVQVLDGVDCGFISRATSNNLTSCYVTGARVGYYIEGFYQNLTNCAADQNIDISYWIKDAQAVKLTSCGTELCTGNKVRIDNSDTVTIDSCLASGNGDLPPLILANYSAIGITAGLPNGEREYTIAIKQSNVVFVDSLFRYDSSKGIASKQELISTDSTVEFINTVIGRASNAYFDFIPVIKSSQMALKGLKYQMFWTDGTTDVLIGSCQRYVMGPLIYILGILYPVSVPVGQDAKQFRVKFRDEYGIGAVGFPDPGIVTGTADWNPTAFGSSYMPIDLVSFSSPTGTPRKGGIDPRDNQLYFYDTDGSTLLVSEAKTLGSSLRFYGMHAIYLGS